MTIERLLAEKREEILRLAASRGARNVRVFGSVARGEAKEDSDIDLLTNAPCVDSSTRNREPQPRPRVRLPSRTTAARGRRLRDGIAGHARYLDVSL